MKLNRLLSILLLIESKKHVTAKELSQLFEVSVRTIYRDIDLLCEAGVPIYATSGPTGGFSFMDGYQLDSQTLHKQDMEKLLFSVYGQLLKDSKSNSHLGIQDPLLLKLQKSIPQKERDNFERLLQTTKLDTKSWWGKEKLELAPESVESKMALIQKSIYNLKKIQFDYESSGTSTKDRILSPYGVVHKGDVWYVVGFAQERNELRTFHSERMQHVKMLEEGYEIPEDFNLEQYWERSTREFVRRAVVTDLNNRQVLATKTSEMAYPVHVLGNSSTASLFTGFRMKTLDTKQGILYEVDLLSERTAMAILLLHLDQVKIEAPQELREKVLKLAENILKKQNS